MTQGYHEAMQMTTMWAAYLSSTLHLTMDSTCDKLVNHTVDFVFEKLLSKYADDVVLPDFVMPFLNGKGNLKVKSGSVTGLKSMKRVGNFLLNVATEKMDISTTVQFRDLIISYKNYTISMFGIVTSGSFTTRVMEVLLKVDLTMMDKSKCLLDVNKVELLELENVVVDFGLCWPSSTWMSKNILRVLNENLRSLVEARLTLILQELFENDEANTICKKSFGESL